MELDSYFILNITNSGISLIMGLYMLFMQKSSYKLGTGFWGAGALIIGIGLLFKAILPVESFFVLVVTPIINTVGLYLYLAGIWRFKEIKIKKWIVIGFPIFDFAQSVIFFHIFNWYRIPMGIHLTILMIYCILAIFEMFQLNSDQKYLKKIFLLNAFSFIIFLSLLILNFIVIIINPDFKLFEPSSILVFIFIFSGLIMISLTFGFLTAVNIRLNTELEDQIKSNTKFLSIIAHDLRGSVGNITNFLDLLQDENTLSEKERKEYLKTINDLSRSTFHLLQNLLEWATKSKHLNKFKSERIDLSQLITDNIVFFKSSTLLKSINLEIRTAERTYMSGNANMIQTIIRNLVSNAIKFTHKGGTITISSEKEPNKVRLIVADSGQGIQAEIINSLFRFETNSSTVGTNGEIGSGLGLVLCKELASKMNGKINIKSQVGVGTKIIIEFPAVE